MGMMAKIKEIVYNNREFLLFLLFSVFCAAMAWSKGCLNEFGNIEAFLLLLGGVLLVIAPAFAEQGERAGKKLILAMLVLMTVGNLIHAALEVYHFHNESYRDVRLDYIIALIAAILVMVIYPKCHRLLSSDLAIALMAAATLGLYAVLFLFGTEVGGVKAWFMGIQLTELIKILFIFVIAGLLSKRQSFVRSGLAILYMAMNVACLAKISEYGTLIVMIFVFLIFLFIFPNKLWWLGGVLLVGVAALGMIYLSGSALYNEALERSPSEAFAAVFTSKVRSVTDENGEELSGVQVLQQMIEKLDSDEDAVVEIKRQLSNGKLTQSDFDAAKEISLSETVTNIKNGTEIDWTDYPAARAVAVLCENNTFRKGYIQNFCRDDFYGYTAVSLYGSMKGGIVHSIKGVILGLYNKGMQRFVIPFASADMLKNVFGIDNAEKPYQVSQAAKAMQIGGLTGASSHEFIYVPVMESDMVFSEVISFFGFAMGLFMMLMYMMMFREGIRIQAQIQRAPFHQGVALGLSLMLFVQALVIVAGNLGVFPLTGITLPFVSAGSISMYVCVMMVTILYTISFIKIEEKTGPMDALFKWLLRSFGSNANEKSQKVLRRGKEMAKEGAEKMKEMAEEMGQAADEDDDNIEEGEDGESGFDNLEDAEEKHESDFDDFDEHEVDEDDFNDFDEAEDGEYEEIIEDDFEEDDETMAWEILSKLRRGESGKTHKDEEAEEDEVVQADDDGEDESVEADEKPSVKIRNSHAPKKKTVFEDWGDDDGL